jgi:hypothetical protein
VSDYRECLSVQAFSTEQSKPVGTLTLDNSGRSRWRFYLLPLLLATLPLIAGGCQSVPVAQCPPLKEYTPEFNQRLGNEVDAMPADSATVEAIGDYIALRDSVRACK